MTSEPPRRTGSSRRADIPRAVLAGLNNGTLQSRTLAEGLAVDFAKLLRAVAPGLDRKSVAAVAAEPSIVRRMFLAGELLRLRLSAVETEKLAGHTSDTVRGWAAYVIGLTPELSMDERLARIQPLADDGHFGVREWAWMAVRPAIAAELDAALLALASWTAHTSANVRRFAVESTRPCGVWCAHIERLKQSPEFGLPLLAPLHSDPARYVQDSVANWLNDAGKSQPAWVTKLCAAWQRASRTEATAYICRRALRNLAEK